MSVLIRGMEMPKNCVECPCCRHDNWNGETAHQCNVSFITFGAEDENWIYNTLPNWCPLIELPPHGRLGDLDALIKDLAVYRGGHNEGYGFDGGMYEAYNNSIELVQDAPVVIEAEGREE